LEAITARLLPKDLGCMVLHVPHQRIASSLAILGGLAALSAAEFPVDGDSGFIPYLAEPARPAPENFVTKDDIFLNGILAGPVALLPAKTSWGVPYGVETAYRWDGGTWQTGVPWLPADRWPKHVRRGYLGYEFQDPETFAVFTEFLDAATGAVRGRAEGSISYAYHFDLNEHAIAVTRGFGPVEIHLHDGERRSIPVRGSSSRDVILDGRELVVFSYDSLDRGSGWLERRSIDTGEVLDSWTLPPRSGIYAFHAGKILAAEYQQWGSFRPLLARAGVAAMEPLVLPEAAQPGSRMLTSDNLGDPNPAARTPTGVWLTLPAEKQNQGALMHLDLSGEVPGWSLGIDSSAIFFNGHRVVTRRDWNEPLLIADADPATLPTAFLVPARSPEISGVLPVKVRLDRPSAATVKVRVTSRNGGTATPGDDFAVFDQWITFPPGAVEAEGLLVVKEDFTPEPHETLVLEITGTENANLPIKTEQVSVIEGSGVQKWISADPAPTGNPGQPTGSSMTGGDGLLYRAGLRNRLEVIEPRTGVVLETVELSLDSQKIETRYVNGYYGPQGTMSLAATADGVICWFGDRTTYGTSLVLWTLSGKRTLPGWSLRVANPVEGGAPGLIEATASERTTAAIPAKLVVSAARMEHGSYGDNSEYSPLSPADLLIPADGTPLRYALPIHSEMATHRSKAPIRLQFHDAAGFITEQCLIEPSPCDYDPYRTMIPLDPALAVTGVGGIMRRGDSLWVCFPKAPHPVSTRLSGCVQELDGTTYEVRRTIWAPAALKHPGFGESIIDAGRDIVIVATHNVDSPNRSTKTTRSLCVLDAASGNFRAVIPWKFWANPTVAFDDTYVAIASASDQDGARKTAGGLILYSRATFKPVASLKLAGEGGGSSMAFAGGALWLGVPNAEWRPPFHPKNEPGQPFAGAVLRFGALPSLKSAQVFISPAATWAPSQFGVNLDVADDGSVLARAFNGIFRIDPVTLAITASPSSARLLPLRNFSRGEGLRSDDYHGIFDEETGMRLTDLASNGRSVIGKDSLLYPSWQEIFSVPFDRAGSFELWQRYAEELPGDPRPDLQRYVEEHVGSIPVVTVTPASGYYRSYAKVNISGPMPPDMTMLVEFSMAGGPWEVLALRNGSGPVRNRYGVADKTAPNEIAAPDLIPSRGARFRARYDLTANLPLALSEYRFLYVKP
jgi:hypothetical protein